MKQFRKFDKELNTILLDDKYLFAYSKGDGFSHGLLSAEFVLDYEYNYTLELNAFQHNKITNNNSNSLIEKEKLTGRELELIENLLSSNYNSLKQEYDYEGLCITDIGSQQIFINLDKKTKYIHISDGLPIECFKTIAEKKLFELNEYFKEFVETKYTKWIAK
ncbi:hypothetical protein [uncultured Tenacibaculum sp.]|uniref:hypothetical protein n=1 Tax=uncultured Tenacibaculum sp. TaxID=174713 RepID=UPI00261567E7|nr:hypothetical protein [uncultured Tenacibaculum sp.]